VSIPLGPGIDAPDVVIVGKPFTIGILSETDSASTRCRIIDAAADRIVAILSRRWNNESTTAAATLHEPGLYRIQVTTGSAEPVERLLLAVLET
jgi:hypothetical protein